MLVARDAWSPIGWWHMIIPGVRSEVESVPQEESPRKKHGRG